MTLVGVPALRLRGLTLAVTTLGLSLGFLRAIVTLARDLALGVIVEGLETTLKLAHDERLKTTDQLERMLHVVSDSNVPHG